MDYDEANKNISAQYAASSIGTRYYAVANDPELRCAVCAAELLFPTLSSGMERHKWLLERRSHRLD